MNVETNLPALPVDASAARPVKTLLVAMLWCVLALCLFAANTMNAVT